MIIDDKMKKKKDFEKRGLAFIQFFFSILLLIKKRVNLSKLTSYV